MKIYLAGPMTGIPQFNFPLFDYWEEVLIQDGHDVFSPAAHDRKGLNKPEDWLPEESDSIGPWKMWSIPDAPTLREILSEDLQYICQEAEGIAMIPGWEKSSGARVEHSLAVALDLGIMYL